MLKQFLKHYLSADLIEQLKTDYYTRDSYDTDTMNKASPQLGAELLEPIVQDIIGKEWKYASGNYYKHNRPYLPHTDFRESWEESINVVIPLEFEGTMAPNLVVFDQWYAKDSVTWCLDLPVIHFDINTGVEGRPCDWPEVQGLTQEPIDSVLWFRYLNWRNKDQWFGLTGEAFAFEPTSLIIFNNKLIHATSQFQGTKLGLSLRFIKHGS